MLGAETDCLDYEKELLRPFTHVYQVSSKEMRKRIQASFNHWLRVPQDKFDEVIDIAEMYHHCCLIVDDMQDDSKCRRGLPSAHIVYGVPLTMNTAYIVIMLVMERCMRLHQKGSVIFCEQFLDMLRGQGKEIYWRDNFICPTEDRYKEMLTQKTGGMLLLSYRLMKLFSDTNVDCSHFVSRLGMYFQLRDDYCNICQPKALEEYSPVSNANTGEFYDDLTEGKFTLPIIHAARTSRGQAVLDILKQRTSDVQLKQHCKAMLEEMGSLQYTRDMLNELDSSLREEIERLGGNPPLVAIMDEMLSWRDE